MSTSKRAVVASGHELVSRVAGEILAAGGNAFDAVVAAGFAGAACEQTLTSLGGGGLLLARTAGGRAIFFDFFVNTPGLGLDHPPEPHFFPVTVNFGGSDQVFNVGMASAAVPGTLKGLVHVHGRLGRMSLAEVLAPAAELARGHELNGFQAGFLKLLHPIMTLTPEGRALYEPGGRYVAPGDRLENPDLAAFIEEVARDGGRDFYEGSTARAVDRAMREGGGLLTARDLAAYEVRELSPLEARYRGRQLLTAPPPSLGGSLIALSLSLLDRLDPEAHPWGSGPHLVRVLGLMQEVERLRGQGVTTPRALEAYLAGEGPERSVERIRLFSRGTTHVSIADAQGNTASMTCSNGEGCGWFVPGTGIMLNNMMGEDDLHPEGFHSDPPGVRVGSMMSPSMLIQDGEPVLVLGSGGSKRIRTAITQVISRIVDAGQGLREAVEAPRLYWDEDILQLEPGFAPEAVEALRAVAPVNLWEERSMYFGGVHLVAPGRGGEGDPPRGGSVLVL